MDKKQVPPEKPDKDIRFEEPTFIDPLTGLFNQYYLHKFFPEEIEKAKLGNYPLTVFMVDLDGFKEVNDTYGHLSGDEVLKQLSAVIKKVVRQTDMIIRYAGDEFALLLPGADVNRSQALSNRLVSDVNQYVFKDKNGQEIHLTISVGIASYPLDTEDPGNLIDLADKALYLSKQKGKNRSSFTKEVTLDAISSLVAMDSFPCAKFIDRQNEIERLRQLFDTVVLHSGLLQVAFISGETGIGKTRLLSELNNYVRDKAELITSHASLAHMQDPYYLLVEGMNDYIEKNGGINSPKIYNIISSIPQEELLELSRIIPQLASLVKITAEAGLDDKKIRFLLFKGFLDLLLEINKTAAVAISLDDVQWADKASLELLRYLIKQEKNKSFFIFGAFTEEKAKAAAKDSNFLGFWEEVRFGDNFAHIKIDNFPLDYAFQMIEVIFPGIGERKDLCELIYDTTKGNPSFIEELLKSLVENAVVFYQDNRWQVKNDLSSEDIPMSLDEVIKKRLRNLDEETKEMIVQAAVIGENFSADLLQKIGGKDEGFMLELLNRAKKMRLVEEIGSKGTFGFINKNVQNILYNNELSDEERNQLHYKVGEAIAKEHGDNLYNVAGELAFHFSKAPHQYKAGEYNKALLEKTSQIFSPYEALEYLNKLATEVAVEEEKVAVILSDKMQKETLRFIRFLQAAVKNFHLYPPGVMRANAVKEAYSVLNIVFQETERITLGEFEKGLVINGKRIPPKEAEHANTDYFLNLMLEQNLKTVTFLKGIGQDEVEKFILFFSKSAEEVKDAGGWPEIIKKEGMRNTRVDEVRLVQLGGGYGKEFEQKKKIEDIMLMEFLLGKIEKTSVDKKAVISNMEADPKKFAQTIMDAAQEVLKAGKVTDELKAITSSLEKIKSEIFNKEGKEGGAPAGDDHAKDMARVILELKPALRNKVIRSQLNESKEKAVIENIVKTTPDEVIADMIAEEHKENKENILVTKSSLDNIVQDEARKKNILDKLKAELPKLNIDKENIGFLSGTVKWEDLSIDERINSIMRLPEKFYSSELAKIRTLLGELDSKHKNQELESFLYHLFVVSGQAEPGAHKDLVKTMTDFTKGPLLDEKIEVIPQEASRFDVFWKRLDIEVDPKIFSGILDILKEIIKEFAMKLSLAKNIALEATKPQVKKNCIFVIRVINALSKRYKWEESHNPQIHKLISDFITEVFDGKLLEVLLYQAINNPPHQKADFKDIFPLVGGKLVSILISPETEKNLAVGDSFREYIIRKEIADFLRNLGSPAVNVLQQELLKFKEVDSAIIELLGYLKSPELVDFLLPFVSSKNHSIRRAAILALGDIGGEKSIEAISRASEKEDDKKMRFLMKDLVRKMKLQQK